MPVSVRGGIQPIIAWFVLFFDQFSPFVNAISSNELCLSKMCSGCMAGSLSCQEGGLTGLPDELAKDIQSMILIGHRFEGSALARHNFTSYPHQTKVLQRITLRNCGIERIQPGSFEPIQSLKQLDLSQNQISFIEAGTFAGSRLDYLRLDENHRLHLAPGAFNDASIVSLSMNQCGIESITYEDLAPLLRHHVLTTLHLSGNRLVTLENRMEPVFLELQSLSLDQNPFYCDCRLSWLAEVLQRRQIRRKSRALKQDSMMGPDAPLDSDLPRPTCRAPDRLAGRPLETLTTEDFFCGLPQLKNLEVFIEEYKEAGETQELVNSVSQPLAVTLRCQVSGSPEMKLAWYRRSIFNPTVTSQLEFYNELNHLSKLLSSRAVSSDVAEIRLIQPSPSISSKHDPISSKSQSSVLEQLVCMATDTSGNISAEVRLQWPPLSFRGQKSLGGMPKRETGGERTLISTSEAQTRKDKMEDWQKKAELDAEIRSNWYILTGEDPSGFWLQKQFSALQMIGAVVGTFTFTLLLFVIGCCLLKARCLHRNCLRSKILLQHASSYQHSSPVSKYSAPPLYSATGGQSQASGINPTTINSTGLNSNVNHAISMAQVSYQIPSLNVLTSNGTVPNELKRLPYTATYEPVTTADQPVHNTYSDTQTYDLPQFPISMNPPNAPLPAVPSTSIPVSVNKTMDSRASYFVPTLTCNQSGHPSSSMFVTNADTMPNGLSLAATLGRLQQSVSPLQGHFSYGQPKQLLVDQNVQFQGLKQQSP
ncbi:Immunoglobulin superfamily member 10 [Fasciola gigantica]|uniref:Immunoglobulin superfamily member 10 n=1 Tax=Fasciola gigantica TaxID=46835 RepID=A0A504YFT2_FASGI|nr:Immunoglobulin superfamily member 10 [Fasciola gigantica]